MRTRDEIRARLNMTLKAKAVAATAAYRARPCSDTYRAMAKAVIRASKRSKKAK